MTLTSSSDVFPQFQRPGTELMYMLEGRMVYDHGSYEYEPAPGDSLVSYGEGPPGPRAWRNCPFRSSPWQRPDAQADTRIMLPFQPDSVGCSSTRARVPLPWIRVRAASDPNAASKRCSTLSPARARPSSRTAA